MKIYYKIIIFVLALLMLVAGLVSIFLITGGKSLVNIYKNYLSVDLAGKKYKMEDFTDRGPGVMLSGYYAGSDKSGIYMWTLSGLKRFSHKQNMSFYYYLDTCGLLKQLEDSEGKPKVDGQAYIEEVATSDFSKWKSSMKKGDYVWVLRVGDGTDSRVIDKVWGNSNNAFPLDKITVSTCE